MNATQEVRESNDLGELNLEYTTSQLKMLCFCRTEKIPRGGPKKVDGWTWSRKIEKKLIVKDWRRITRIREEGREVMTVVTTLVEYTLG